MKPRCIRMVDRMEEEHEWFASLSVEQLLYACIKELGVSEVRAVLDTTDWDTLTKGAHK